MAEHFWERGRHSAGVAMKILIVYATTDGQTRKIAQFSADHLTEVGHTVELLQAGDADRVDLSRFGAVMVAGSLHAGGYQHDLEVFAKTHAEALTDMGALFVAVSLSAAGNDEKDWDGLRQCVTQFCDKTGWTPARIEHVAGAFMFTQYDFFRSWAMRWIAAQKGEEVSRDEDKEYTDWAALAAMLDDWVKGQG